jgi:tRNA(Ile)-lysidine synthase
MKDLAQRFSEHWKTKKFPTGQMLLALSGGIDSMVLAHLLRKAGISFAAAHCNFMLRGKDADDDTAFVQEWCATNDVRCHTISFDTKMLAARRRQSIQTTARDLRYEWFETLRKEHRYTAILTAHHAGDVAETMLINLSRGSGIAGLHGIPERNGAIMRPLLFASRADIAEYAAINEIAWREDASNATDNYLRNAIRLHVLPQLENLLPGAVARMAMTAARLHGTELIYRKALDRRLRRLKEQRGKDWYIPLRLLLQEAAPDTIAYELFTPFGFSSEQIPQILSLAEAESGKQVLSDTYRVIRHRDFLVVTAIEERDAGLILVTGIPTHIHTAEGSFHFSWADAQAPVSTDANIAMIDGDTLSFPLVLRTRREGDYFYPLGMGMKKKKLKRFLIDIKTPLQEKDRVRILECDKKILWITGKRIDERFKVRPTTERVLKIVFEPAE